MILRVVASESGTGQTSVRVRWGCRTPTYPQTKWKWLGSQTKEGDSPVHSVAGWSILSTTEHANSVGSRAVHGPSLNTLDDR